MLGGKQRAAGISQPQMVPIKTNFFLVNPQTSLRYIFISELSEEKKKLQHDPLLFWPHSLFGLCSEQAQKIHFMLKAGPSRDPETKNS